MKDLWAPTPLASCGVLKLIGTYLCFTLICGIVLNSIVLYILIRIKKHRSPIDIFIIALCTSDLLATVLEIPLPLISNLSCRWIFGKYLCYYEAFIAYFVGMVGLYLLTALSLNRYWIVVTPSREQHITFRPAYVSVVLSILGGLFWAVPPIFGWNSYRLEGVKTTCSISWQDRTMNVMSYNILMFIFAYIVPTGIMIYCNTCIYFKVREATNHRSSQCEVMTSDTLQKKKLIMEQRMTKTVFLIIINFVLAWTPYAIIAFISSFISPSLVSPLAGTIPAIFAKSSVYFNPFVYIMANSFVRSTILSRRRAQQIENNESGSSKQQYERIPFYFLIKKPT